MQCDILLNPTMNNETMTTSIPIYNSRGVHKTKIHLMKANGLVLYPPNTQLFIFSHFSQKMKKLSPISNVTTHTSLKCLGQNLTPMPCLSQPTQIFFKIWIKVYKDYCLLETNQSTLDHQWPVNPLVSQF